MGFRINTNVASLTAQTSAAVNNRNLDNSLSKLSSGLRINKAADDASGLAIANSLRAQASSLGQAINNGNDAIGLIQTADGALSEYSNILDTIKTKSVQAASDGQNAASRLAIQKDINRLLENLNNIAKTTSFNGQKLLSGTFTNKEFQVGANANETIKASIASAETSQIGQTSRATLSVAQLGENQLTLKSAVSGTSIKLESVNLQMNNDPANGMGALADIINKHSAETGITAKAVVSSTTAAITAGTTGSDFAINGVNIGAINVSANDSKGTLLTAINNKATETGVTATKTADGKLTLTSSDGRAISVTGDLSGVTTSTGKDLSTIGHLEVVQAGSSTFQITGSSMGTAVGKAIVTTGNTTTIEDSILAAGTILSAGTQLAEGTVIGGTVVNTGNYTATKDSVLVAGSTVLSGSTLSKGTQITGDVTVNSSVPLSSDMLLKAGSVLKSGTTFDAGTVLQEDITAAGGTLYKAGTVLHTDIAITGSITLAKDMVMKVDVLNNNSAIATGSKLLSGTVLGADVVTTGDVTIGANMIEARNITAVTKLVIPVLPPAAIPALDSTTVVTVDVPTIAPAAVEIASDINASFM